MLGRRPWTINNEGSSRPVFPPRRGKAPEDVFLVPEAVVNNDSFFRRKCRSICKIICSKVHKMSHSTSRGFDNHRWCQRWCVCKSFRCAPVIVEGIECSFRNDRLNVCLDWTKVGMIN